MRQRLAMASWRTARSGQAHAFLDFDVTEAEAWCRGQTGVSLTVLAGAALGHALAAVPDLNTRAVLGRVRRRPAVDVSYVVDVGRGRDMTAVCVRQADAKGPREVARELLRGARAARRGEDRQFGRSLRLGSWMPGPLLRTGVATAGFITSGIGRRMPLVRLDPFPLGSAMVSSVAPWGIGRALPPLVPFARLGLVIVVGAPSWQPRVVDGEVVPRRVVELGLTADHRLVDGAHVGELAALMRQRIEQPWTVWPDGSAPPG